MAPFGVPWVHCRNIVDGPTVRSLRVGKSAPFAMPSRELRWPTPDTTNGTATYMPTLTLKTTPTDRQSYGSPRQLVSGIGNGSTPGCVRFGPAVSEPPTLGTSARVATTRLL